MTSKYTFYLMLLHISIITISNVLVQYPFTLFGLHTTWGAFTYPVIFIATDLTVRLLGKGIARLVVFKSMFPGLLISYFLASVFDDHGSFKGVEAVFNFDLLAFRVSLACFTAYLTGQLLDIKVFQRFRNNYRWWVAPTISSFTANIIDTIVFFSIAFYKCDVPVLRDHWPEIALIDFCFKYIMTIFFFVPLYGIILKSFWPSKLGPDTFNKIV